MNILNLTQHKATPEQTKAGVVEPARFAEQIRECLNFAGIHTREEILERAERLARIAQKGLGASAVMIGGAPYLMGALETACIARGLRVLYAFSERKCVETQNPDGSVSKSQVFSHLGFVDVTPETTNWRVEFVNHSNTLVVCEVEAFSAGDAWAQAYALAEQQGWRDEISEEIGAKPI